jgi:hypothetical protein
METDKPPRPHRSGQIQPHSSGVIGAYWRTPELVDEPVAGDDLVGVQQQGGEQGALFRAAVRNWWPFLQYLQRPENPELYVCFSP